MSSNGKTERAAKTKATKAIKSLAKSSKRRVKQEDDVPVVGIKKQEIEVCSEDEVDPEEMQREKFASECRRNWRNMDGMAKCLECFKGIGFYETECEFCGEIMKAIRFGECVAGCVGVQGAPGKCGYCESVVYPFGG